MFWSLPKDFAATKWLGYNNQSNQKRSKRKKNNPSNDIHSNKDLRPKALALKLSGVPISYIKVSIGISQRLWEKFKPNEKKKKKRPISPLPQHIIYFIILPTGIIKELSSHQNKWQLNCSQVKKRKKKII